jgi:FixJ family two-component response regulator
VTDARPVVHVVDDDPAVRDSLRWLIEGEGLLVQAHASAEDFLGALVPEQPGCALVDLRMPGMSGLELQQALARRGVGLPLVFISAHGEVPLAVTAMRRGAVDFVEKPFDNGALLDTVRRALGADVLRRVGDEERAAMRARLATLSPREREVLEAVVAGRANKRIAAALGISIKTVEVHRARVMDKMGASSIAELVRLVVQHGLLDAAVD